MNWHFVHTLLTSVLRKVIYPSNRIGLYKASNGYELKVEILPEKLDVHSWAYHIRQVSSAHLSKHSS